MMRLPTIRDVARKAHVSVATVSRVINDSPNVRPETRQRVLDAIEDLNFHPNPAAQRLSGGKTSTIGVIAPFFTRPAFATRLAGIQEILDESKYDLVLYSIRSLSQLEKRLSSLVGQNRVDGLISISVHIPEEMILEGDPDLPVVSLDDERIKHFPSIVIDNVYGGQLATQYLIDKGYTRIGFIGDSNDPHFNFVSSQRRFEGFRQALEAKMLAFEPQWHLFGLHGVEQAYRNALEIFRLPHQPEAIFAASDTQAFGVLKAAREVGLNVPDDVAVIGFDDIEASEYLNLTTIGAHLYDSGQMSARLLLRWLLAGDVHPDKWQTFLPLEIIERHTV
jgi:DNA-binding LacI/PurR family transcriptional regulator